MTMNSTNAHVPGTVIGPRKLKYLPSLALLGALFLYVLGEPALLVAPAAEPSPLDLAPLGGAIRAGLEILVSLTSVATATYVILSKRYGSRNKPQAYIAVVAVICYWLFA